MDGDDGIACEQEDDGTNEIVFYRDRRLAIGSGSGYYPLGSNNDDDTLDYEYFLEERCDRFDGPENNEQSPPIVILTVHVLYVNGR